MNIIDVFRILSIVAMFILLGALLITWGKSSLKTKILLSIGILISSITPMVIIASQLKGLTDFFLLVLFIILATIGLLVEAKSWKVMSKEYLNITFDKDKMERSKIRSLLAVSGMLIGLIPMLPLTIMFMIFFLTGEIKFQ